MLAFAVVCLAATHRHPGFYRQLNGPSIPSCAVIRGADTRCSQLIEKLSTKYNHAAERFTLILTRRRTHTSPQRFETPARPRVNNFELFPALTAPYSRAAVYKKRKSKQGTRVREEKKKIARAIEEGKVEPEKSKSERCPPRQHRRTSRDSSGNLSLSPSSLRNPSLLSLSRLLVCLTGWLSPAGAVVHDL